jgi:hypothetical protein
LTLIPHLHHVYSVADSKLPCTSDNVMNHVCGPLKNEGYRILHTEFLDEFLSRNRMRREVRSQNMMHLRRRRYGRFFRDLFAVRLECKQLVPFSRFWCHWRFSEIFQGKRGASRHPLFWETEGLMVFSAFFTVVHNPLFPGTLHLFFPLMFVHIDEVYRSTAW